MIIEFYKYQGTGNDFIIIDDRINAFDESDTALISALCARRTGIGADGLILLRNHEEYDFEMCYFNSDGYTSSMCGNGGRCVIDFARVLDIIHNEVTFMAVDGVHKGRVLDQGIALKMQDVHVIQKMDKGLFLDTGSPHYVLMVDELKTLDVE